MLQNYNKWKVLQVFFDDPLAEGGLQLREIGRKINLALPSVRNYLLELEREKLISKKKNRVQGYPTYKANRDDENFKFYKKMDIIIKIRESGLLDEIYDKCLPDAIVLFGSASRGEDVKNSDIDIFMLAKQKKLDLKRFEKYLGREINLFFEEKFLGLSKELRNNIINGTLLKGYLEVL